MMPSPQRSPVSGSQADEQPSQSSRFPSSHCSAPHTAPSPQPVSRRQPALQPSQLVSLPSSHSSPVSSLPLPHSAPGGGCSTFTNLPCPGSPGPGGSFDVQVHTLLSASNSISRVKLARVGSGKTVKRSPSGSKRTSVSELEPLTHTWAFRRLT